MQENLGEIQRVFADHGLRANVRLQVRCLIERERERERESEKGGREGGRERASERLRVATEPLQFKQSFQRMEFHVSSS